MAANKIRLWTPVLICMGIIFYFSSIPGGRIPYFFSFQSAIFHFFTYFMLGLFFCRALRNTYSGLFRLKVILFGVGFGLIYGLLDELHQSFIPFRSVSGLDVFIDTLGTFAGSLIYR